MLGDARGCSGMPGDARGCPGMPGDARRCPEMLGDAEMRLNNAVQGLRINLLCPFEVSIYWAPLDSRVLIFVHSRVKTFKFHAFLTCSAGHSSQL